ncbi:hypothetical protein [Actinoplanes couchii]|uniref:Uncharacterized protein n=1 Tax=Actinoplanes couchii TaxID=403638 RepID=A0ABQ3XG16_9ACTN|nr:hypothetical protein [Actinoplanes couchii]MDR6320937.1 hypothetical protein [Actinoplanes couchii]GID57449.1 hypothetical protein Aco03nite_058530 [Actinoplanes couchii]
MKTLSRMIMVGIGLAAGVTFGAAPAMASPRDPIPGNPAFTSKNACLDFLDEVLDDVWDDYKCAQIGDSYYVVENLDGLPDYIITPADPLTLDLIGSSSNGGGLGGYINGVIHDALHGPDVLVIETTPVITDPAKTGNIPLNGTGATPGATTGNQPPVTGGATTGNTPAGTSTGAGSGTGSGGGVTITPKAG